MSYGVCRMHWACQSQHIQNHWPELNFIKDFKSMSIKSIKISGFEISESGKPFIIAEMSGNHNQSLDRALAIVEAAAAAGAHAVKLQTYTADTMTLNLRSD